METKLNNLAKNISDEIDKILLNELRTKQTFAEVSKKLTAQKFEDNPVKREVINLALAKLYNLAYSQLFNLKS